MRSLWRTLVLSLSLLAVQAFALDIDARVKGKVPDSGDMEVTITVRGDDGKPLDGAKVSLLASMPPMGTMPYMEAVGDVTPAGKGSYDGVVELTMGGTWDITITVEARGGKKQVGRYSVTTGIPGLVDKAGGAKAAAGGGDDTAVSVSPARIQRMGVRFATAKSVPLNQTFRAVAEVQADESLRADAILRAGGYVEKLYGLKNGDKVTKGQILARIDSPELAAAQEEYLLALNMSGSFHANEELASQRLRTLGMSGPEIQQLRRSRKVSRIVELRAPMAGTVLDSTAREGMQVGAGQVLFVIGNLDKTFLVAKVFQQDALNVIPKAPVQFRVLGRPKLLRGHVDLVYPSVSGGDGTVSVRVVPDEGSAALRPGVFAEVLFSVNHGDRLAVPSEAILYSGEHRYVFRKRGEGLLEPVEVETGLAADGMTEIAGGLKPGDEVAASGTFLLGSEANLRSALPKWADGNGSHSHHGP